MPAAITRSVSHRAMTGAISCATNTPRIETPPHICAGTGLASSTFAPGLGSPLPHLPPGLGSPRPHLCQDWARHPSYSAQLRAYTVRVTLPLASTVSFSLSTSNTKGIRCSEEPKHKSCPTPKPLPHLRQDYEVLVGSHPCRIHLSQDWAHPGHICTGTGLTPPTSAPGLGTGTEPKHKILSAQKRPKVTEAKPPKTLPVSTSAALGGLSAAMFVVGTYDRTG